MATTTKKKEPEQKTLEENNVSNRTALALVPPTSLLAPAPVSEAEQAFLAESEELPSGPTKLPCIAVNHKDGEFVMPDGQTIDGEAGIRGFIIAHFTTRAYYKDAFDPKADKGPPDCSSADCIVPDANVRDKQSPDCASCRHNAFGTAKVGKGKACREFLRLFMVNPEFGNPPLAVLTLPPTAIGKFYGGQMVIGGKRGYLDQLRSRHRAWQIVWSQVNLKRLDDDDVYVVPEFTMGEIASVDVAKALAAINNQFVSAIKAARREVPQDAKPGPGSGDAAE